MISADRTAFAVLTATLVLVVVWQVAPVSWTDASGCDTSPPSVAQTAAVLDAKLEAVLGPPGASVEEELLRATLRLSAKTDLSGGRLAITINGVRRVFWRSTTDTAVWVRTE